MNLQTAFLTWALGTSPHAPQEAPQALHGKVPSCDTRCGMTALYETDCSDLQALEDVALMAFEEYAEIPHRITCFLLGATYIFTHEYTREDKRKCAKGWVYKDGLQCIEGSTSYDTGVVEVGSFAKNGAYAHELAHLLDLAKYSTHGHCNWPKKGFMKAIEQVTGEADTTPNECPQDGGSP